jgi:outer membrane protein OmpA-like peptidoglycan-associated protein
MIRTRLLVLLGVVLVCGCGPRRVVTRVANPDLVVLLPEPDGGAVGRASVSNQQGSVDLEGARAATRVLPGQAPAAVASMSEAEVASVFGEALAATPMAPQFFVLYFRFESNVLTDESRALFPQVLKAVASYAAPEVVAVGHTDTTGDPKANIDLGLNRADAVRTMLIGAGLDAALIEVRSHGEADLLIKTPDETSEPRNRRVEIAIR